MPYSGSPSSSNTTIIIIFYRLCSALLQPLILPLVQFCVSGFPGEQNNLKHLARDADHDNNHNDCRKFKRLVVFNVTHSSEFDMETRRTGEWTLVLITRVYLKHAGERVGEVM